MLSNRYDYRGAKGQPLRRVDDEYATFPDKDAPVANDYVLIEDSQTAGAKRRVTVQNLVSAGSVALPTPWLIMTTIQMNAIPSPTAGMAVFNTTKDQIMVYTAAQGWVGVAITL